MNKKNLILKKTKQETKDTKTLFFEILDQDNFSFKAGQFLNLFFLDNKDGHGKPYTISSAPNEELQITIKKIGKFSGKLHEIKEGEKIIAQGPLGFMTLEERENKNNKIVFIAGGIGITPFYSMIKDVILKNTEEEMHLFYSNKKISSVIFLDKLNILSKENSNLHIKHFLTQEEYFGKNIINRRLKVSDIEEKLNSLKDTDFYICGSIPFVNDF